MNKVFQFQAVIDTKYGYAWSISFQLKGGELIDHSILFDCKYGRIIPHPKYVLKSPDCLFTLRFQDCSVIVSKLVFEKKNIKKSQFTVVFSEGVVGKIGTIAFSQ